MDILEQPDRRHGLGRQAQQADLRRRHEGGPVHFARARRDEPPAHHLLDQHIAQPPRPIRRDIRAHGMDIVQQSTIGPEGIDIDILRHPTRREITHLEKLPFMRRPEPAGMQCRGARPQRRLLRALGQQLRRGHDILRDEKQHENNRHRQLQQRADDPRLRHAKAAPRRQLGMARQQAERQQAGQQHRHRGQLQHQRGRGKHGMDQRIPRPVMPLPDKR